MGENTMEIAAYGFRVWTDAFIKMGREGRLEELRTMGMDHINGFIVIRNEGLLPIIPVSHTWLYITPEARDEGLRLAQEGGLPAEPIDEPIMIPVDVVLKKPEAQHEDD